ncbi:MAG: hypothetical protein ABL995_02220 [Bryobacteraceae bacterium]
MVLLAAVWFLALVFLWADGSIFLPNSENPLVPLNGPWERLYINAGRLLLFMGPLFIGWGIGLIAARQRAFGLWPIVGLVPVAWLESTTQIEVLPTAHVAVGIGVHFSLSPHGIPEMVLRSLFLATVTALPWLIWRVRDTVLRTGFHNSY